MQSTLLRTQRATRKPGYLWPLSAAIESSYSQFDWQEFDIGVDETVVSGDVGYARGTFAASMVPRAGGERISIDGKYLTIFRKDDTGEWTIYRDSFNSNR